jgi:hypothetical protein
MKLGSEDRVSLVFSRLMSPPRTPMIPPDLAFVHPRLDSAGDSDEDEDGVWHKPPVTDAVGC